MRIHLLIFAFSIVSLSLSCTTAESPTTNGNVVSGNVIKNINAADLPPGFSTSPVPMTGSTPGIPGPNDVNANKIPAGGIPGIPDPSKIGKTPQPKVTPPIPGIPDQETIKRQMNTPLKDVNVVNNPSRNPSDANNQPTERPRGNSRQP